MVPFKFRGQTKPNGLSIEKHPTDKVGLSFSDGDSMIKKLKKNKFTVLVYYFILSPYCMYILLLDNSWLGNSNLRICTFMSLYPDCFLLSKL